jgi:hypothetical protein
MGDPGVVCTHVVLLPEVREQIDELWRRQRLRRVLHLPLQDQVHFPIPPFDGGQPVGHERRETVAVGILLFAEEEVRLVHAVNRAIFRDLGSADVGKSCIEVYDVNDLVADASSRHLARPSDNERGAYPAFHRREIGARPGPVGSLSRVSSLTAIVAGEDDQRVLFDACGFDGVEYLASAMVHLSEAICPIAVAGFAGELGIGHHRDVDQGE